MKSTNRYEAAKLNQEASYRHLIENLKDYAVFMMDHEGNIATWNEGAERQFGYSEKEAIGKNFSIIFTKEDQKLGIPKQEIKTAKTQGKADDERKHVHKNGREFWSSGVVVPLKDDNGKLLGFTKIVRDVSERKKAEGIIRHLAMHDTLTGLPNRIHMYDLLTKALIEAKRHKELLALAFADLDRFKMVNDTEGHDMGDLLLQEVAVRISSSLRQGDTVARLGGDEFVIILRKQKSPAQIIKTVEKILFALGPKFVISSKILNAKASIGVAIYPQDGKDMNSLMKRADQALYKAKASGGNCVKLYKEISSK
ncbi:MAG TPA: diguanylate cyclase [Verrucomicrobiae bacterium]|nr:diguanylate cyclase [Verrucomicrobiae bacterium]